MLNLESWIAEGEHETQDFKFRIEDQKKIARTLCAFANTKGGRLLVGVKDNGKISGCYPEEEFHMIEGAASIYCKPKVEFSSFIWQDDHKLILIIEVHQADKKGVMALDESNNYKCFIRINDNTILANKILVKSWKMKANINAKPVKFDSDETGLLALIGEYGEISLSQLYKKSQLSKNKIDYLLSCFLCWDVIKIVYSENKTLFSLN
jgi:predicted HTH transcriptional regulator